MRAIESDKRDGWRLGRFSLKSLLLAFLGASVLLVPAREIYNVWQSTYVETMAVRLSSTGEITWGNSVLKVSEMRPHLERVVSMWSSYDITPQLVIECYADTRESDITALREIAREAGIQTTRIERHDWPSPEWRLSTE